MKRRPGKPATKWWEILWYLLVTTLLLLVGLVMWLVGLTVRIAKSGSRGSLTKKIIMLAIALLLATAGFSIAMYVYPTGLGDRVVSIIVHPGDDFQSIGRQLVDSGVVWSLIALEYPARWRGIDRKLIPGRYDFTGSNSCRSVLDKLQRGDIAVIKVTVYEGAPIWKVASILARKMEVDSAAIIAHNNDPAYLRRLGVPSLEGYLFPDTYLWPWGTCLDTIISNMVATYRTRTAGIWSEPIPQNLSREQIIILASIIEAEARLDAEKPRIASVYHNRIRQRMRLDADPTVIYALGGLARPLSRRDLDSQSPYNTYRRKGLPPTPINSPGLLAIQAALHPETTEYLFFVADGSGGHRFSRTNDEHNRARYEIKRKLRGLGD
jgi:UPF0755 protein